MAKIDISLSSLIDDNGKSEILFRVNVNRNNRIRVKSGLFVYPNRFKDGEIKPPRIEDGNGRRKETVEVQEKTSTLITRIINYCENNKDITKEDLIRVIDRFNNPAKEEAPKEKAISMCEIFQQYVNVWLETGVIGDGRKKHYDVIIRELQRFFIINNIDGCLVESFNKDMLLNFREFLRIEHTLVDEYPGLYINLNERNKPSKERSQNTIAGKLLLLQTFMNELESNDIIPISPFRKVSKGIKKSIMKQQYDEPICLTKEEFSEILNKNCSDTLKRVRDIFIVQCCFGCRVGDFRRLKWDNISIENNIPYIHYLPQKTIKKGDVRIEIKTPIIRIAYEILKKYRNEMDSTFLLPYYPDGNGETGYNYQIKMLLQYCDISRKVPIYNTEEAKNEYKPIYDIGSSKLARKTFVDLMNKVQIDKYAAGLHSRNSNSVARYTNLGIKEQFVLMCAAFGCEPYKVNDKLEVL